MKKLVFYILILMLFSNAVIAKVNNKDSLPLIDITNEDFSSLID